MARSESQGLQIAVILFTMLTVGLSLATYSYFTAYTSEYEKRKQSETTANEANDKFEKQSFKLMSYQYLLGVGNITKPQLDTLKTRFAKDEELEKAMEAYDKAVAGNKIAISENIKNYPALPMFYITEIGTRNEALVSEKENVVKVNKEKEVIDQNKVKEVTSAEGAKADAETKLTTKTQEFATYLAEHKKKLDELKADLDRKVAEVGAQQKKHQEEIQRLTQTIGQVEKERDIWHNKYENGVVRVGPIYEAPDGEVTWVNQRERLVWINVGHADGLARQTTFTVHDHDENGLSSHEEKARVEVLRIMEPHLAECRILKDSAKNPILPGDKLFTPAWSPGQRLHFALAGTIDFNGDGRSDREEVKNIITMNGGLVDAEQLEDGKRVGEISYETRYLIRGKAPTERDFAGDAGKRAFQTYTEMVGSAEKKNVELIDIPRFLAMMGWKSQQKTIAIGTKRTAGSGATKAGSAIAGDEPGEAKPASPKATKEEKPAAAGGAADDPFK